MAEHYASPAGSPTGDGSIGNPWDLATALAHPAAVQPGDTIWLRGGTYTAASTTVTLAGNASNDITVRSYSGEWAILDTYDPANPNNIADLAIQNDYVTIRDLEVFSSKPLARVTTSSSPDAPDSEPVLRRGSIRNYGRANKFLNLTVHDLLAGFANQHDGEGGQVNGCIVFNCGYVGENSTHTVKRGFDHGLYIQNNGTLQKTIKDNIVFNNFDYGLHAYDGSAGNRLNDLQFNGNVSFDNGFGGASLSDFLLGSVASNDITVTECYSYNSSGLWRFQGGGTSLTFTNNYLASGTLSFSGSWSPTTSTANTNVGTTTNSPGGITTLASGTTNAIYVRPNDNTSGRGHIIVFNWEDLSSVNVDVSSILSNGSSYEIYHVYDLDTPLHTGTYSGGTVAITMQNTVAPTPLGDLTGAGYSAPTLPKEFGAFLVKTVQSFASIGLAVARDTAISVTAVLSAGTGFGIAQSEAPAATPVKTVTAGLVSATASTAAATIEQFTPSNVGLAVALDVAISATVSESGNVAGLSTATATAPAAVADKNTTPDEPSAAGTALAATVTKTLLTGLAESTSESLASTFTPEVELATTTSEAFGATRLKTRSLSQPAATSWAFPTALTRTYTSGIATSSSSTFTPTRERSLTTGLPTATAEAPTATQQIPVGIATATTTALPLRSTVLTNVCQTPTLAARKLSVNLTSATFTVSLTARCTK